MGFFNTIGSAAGTYASGGLSQGGGLGQQGAIGNALAPTIPQAPAPPPVDPRLKTISDQQYQLADQFRQTAPGLQSEQQTQAGDQAKMNLDSTDRGITASANQRGLLYSGMKTGDQAQAGVQAAAGLAKSRTAIAKDFQQQQQALDQQAFQSGAQLQDLNQKRYDMIYQQQADRAKEQVASDTSLLGTVGNGFKFGGSLFGG